jgi:hypothetical protein
MTTIHMSIEITGDPGQIMSNFVNDMGTSSFLPVLPPWQQPGGPTSGGVKISNIE